MAKSTLVFQNFFSFGSKIRLDLKVNMNGGWEYLTDTAEVDLKGSLSFVDCDEFLTRVDKAVYRLCAQMRRYSILIDTADSIEDDFFAEFQCRQVNHDNSGLQNLLFSEVAWLMELNGKEFVIVTGDDVADYFKN